MKKILVKCLVILFVIVTFGITFSTMNSYAVEDRCEEQQGGVCQNVGKCYKRTEDGTEQIDTTKQCVTEKTTIHTEEGTETVFSCICKTKCGSLKDQTSAEACAEGWCEYIKPPPDLPDFESKCEFITTDNGGYCGCSKPPTRRCLIDPKAPLLCGLFKCTTGEPCVDVKDEENRITGCKCPPRREEEEDIPLGSLKLRKTE